MKKRLVIVLLTALLLMSLAVSVSAEYFYPEFQPYRRFTTNDGGFSIIPIENNTSVIKVVIEGEFESLSESYPLQFSLITSVNGVNEQINYRFYEPTTQLTCYIYGNYSAQVEYDFTYVLLGGDVEYLSSVNFYIATLDSSFGYDSGYEDGYNDGMDTSEALGGAFEGFFNGMANFMDTFMDVGIGALTIRNMVGLCVIAVLVMVVIKVVRG